jgi:hypothetical protein
MLATDSADASIGFHGPDELRGAFKHRLPALLLVGISLVAWLVHHR